MKNFLVKSLLISLVLSFTIGNAYASDSRFYINFFQKIDFHPNYYFNIEEKGIEIEREILNIKEDRINNSFELSESKNLKNNSFDQILEEIYPKKLILICNSKFEEENFFECDSENFKFLGDKESYTEEKFFNKETGEGVFIYLANFKGLEIFVLNESSFRISSQQEMIHSYFYALRENTKIPKEELKQNSSLRGFDLDSVKNSFSFELFIYVLISFIFLVIFYRLISLLPKSSNKYSLPHFISVCDEFIFGIFKTNFLTRSFYIFCITSYLGILYFFTQLYGLKQTFSILLLSSTKEVIFLYESKDFDKIIFIVISYLFLLFLALSRIDTVSEIFKNLFLKISQTNIVKSSFKYLYIFSNFVLLVFIILLLRFGWFEVLLFLIFLNLYLSFLVWKERIVISDLLSKYDKIFVCVFLVFLVGFYFLINRISLEPKTRYDKLIGVSDKIVILPYQKNTTNEVLISKFEEELTFPLFVDNYLVYYPGYREILNLPAKDFSRHENSIITTFNIKSLISALIDNKYLLDNSLNQNVSRFFYLESVLADSEVKLILNASCGETNSRNIKLISYTSNSEGIDSEDTNLGTLLSCDKNIVEYSFSLNNDDIKNNSINELLFDENIYLKSVFIEKDRVREELLYIPVKKVSLSGSLDMYYLDFRKDGEDRFVNYYLGDHKSYVVDRNLRIDEVLNYFKKQSYIGNDFKIWTLNKYQIIKNSFRSP